MSAPTPEPPATAPPLDADTEEALRRCGAVWVGLDGREPAAVWHVYRDGALLLVAGGGEQSLPGAGSATRARVVVRRRGPLAGRQAALEASVARLRPGSPEWDAAVAALVPERLNADHPARLPELWADASLVLRLTPDGAGTPQPTP